MLNDPIVEEVRAVRDVHAKQFRYDLKAIVADLKKQQRLSGHRLASDSELFSPLAKYNTCAGYLVHPSDFFGILS